MGETRKHVRPGMTGPVVRKKAINQPSTQSCRQREKGWTGTKERTFKGEGSGCQWHLVTRKRKSEEDWRKVGRVDSQRKLTTPITRFILGKKASERKNTGSEGGLGNCVTAVPRQKTTK